LLPHTRRIIFAYERGDSAKVVEGVFLAECLVGHCWTRCC